MVDSQLLLTKNMKSNFFLLCLILSEIIFGGFGSVTSRSKINQVRRNELISAILECCSRGAEQIDFKCFENKGFPGITFTYKPCHHFQNVRTLPKVDSFLSSNLFYH